MHSPVRECQRGKLERAQEYLSGAVADDADFLRLFDDFLVGAILPRLKARLHSAGVHDDGNSPVTFFYQRPPTLRIQPGPVASRNRDPATTAPWRSNAESWRRSTGRPAVTT